ncbi:MAG: PAS domain S-box protein [Bacteroidales bacterium]|nr:MAG: PAS domain S-box protein [Bacteroidales bacterium]
MLTALFSAVTVIFLCIGIYVILIKPREPLNRIFFIITLFISIQSLAALLVQLPVIRNNQKTLIFWALVGSHAFFFTLYFLVIFYIQLTKFIKVKWYVALVLLIMPLSILYKSLIVDKPFTFVTQNDIVYFESYHNTINYATFFVILYLIFMLFLITRWLLKSSKKREKIQAGIILLSQFVTLVLILIDSYVLFYLTQKKDVFIPGIITPLFLIWILGIGYTMIRYRFLILSPDTVCKDVLSNIEESVILLGPHHNIIYINKIAAKTIYDGDPVAGKHISTFIKEYNYVQNEFGKLDKESYSDFSCRLNFIKKDGGMIYMDTKIKLIRDKFNDFLGILILARPVKELIQMREHYNISEREAQVVQMVITGNTNKKIAYELSISERTVKTHLTRIFNKMGVDNKIQLMMLLKEFNLIPDQPAEKTLLVN